jgi:hypothetical protein
MTSHQYQRNSATSRRRVCWQPRSACRLARRFGLSGCRPGCLLLLRLPLPNLGCCQVRRNVASETRMQPPMRHGDAPSVLSTNATPRSPRTASSLSPAPLRRGWSCSHMRMRALSSLTHALSRGQQWGVRQKWSHSVHTASHVRTASICEGGTPPSAVRCAESTSEASSSCSKTAAEPLWPWPCTRLAHGTGHGAHRASVTGLLSCSAHAAVYAAPRQSASSSGGRGCSPGHGRAGKASSLSLGGSAGGPRRGGITGCGYLCVERKATSPCRVKCCLRRAPLFSEVALRCAACRRMQLQLC